MNRINYIIVRNKHTAIGKLGRWSTIKNINVPENKTESTIEKNVDWANHDHCGGELCQIPDNKKDDKNNDNDNTYKMDFYIPYVLL